MKNWTYTEELRSQLRRTQGGRYAGRDHWASRDVARMLSPWRRGPRHGGPHTAARRG